MGYNTVALLSGGKDSCYNMLECTKHGHRIIALANLHTPENNDGEEMDSFMFQTVGGELVKAIAECMELPLYRRPILGKAVSQGMEYSPNDGDEVEDLLQLLKEVKSQLPEVEAVSCGAILSTYQRNRVEDVCSRLGLICLGYMWQRDQREVLHEMINNGIEAILFKIASMGLTTSMLGRPLGALTQKFDDLYDEFGFHVCGEGGEYETITLDMPLFKKKIVLDKVEKIMHEDVLFSPVAYLKIIDFHLEPKVRMVDVPRLIKPKFKPLPSLTKTVVELPSVGKTRAFRTGDFVLSKLCVAPECFDGPIEDEVRAVMNQLGSQLKPFGITFKDIAFVHLFVSDMSLFADINKVYCQYFGSNPPSRACVQSNMKDVRVSVDAIATLKAKSVLHVRSISRWAPVCIGPYAQANVVEPGIIFVAGQIALDPGFMIMCGADPMDEMRLSLRHVSRILDCLGSNVVGIIGVIVYTTFDDPPSLNAVENLLTGTIPGATPVVFCVVPTLPRGASVEVEVVAVKTAIQDVQGTKKISNVLSCPVPGHLNIKQCVISGLLGTLSLHLTLSSNVSSITEGEVKQVAKAILMQMKVGGFKSNLGSQLRVFYKTSSKVALCIVTELIVLVSELERALCAAGSSIPPGHTLFSWKSQSKRRMLGHTNFSESAERVPTNLSSPPPIILPVPITCLHNDSLVSIFGTFYPA